MTDQVTAPADFGTNPQGTAQRWISEIDLAEKERASWTTRCRKIIKRYTEDRTDDDRKKRRFALLYSNIQILGPAIYARPPEPVVTRRYNTDDPIARAASEVLERALSYSVDEYDFDGRMQMVRDGYLLVGQGQMWMRYEPHMKTVQTAVSPVLAQDGPQVTDDTSAAAAAPPAATAYQDATGAQHDPKAVKQDEQGNSYIEEQALDYETVCPDFVSWDNFLTNPARMWEEVRWCSRTVFLTRDELKARFGPEIGQAVPLDWTPNGKRDSDRDEQFKKAVVYEIWDEPSKTVIWINKGYNKSPLDQRTDPLGTNDLTGQPVRLKGFFPCPRVLLGTTGPNSLVPIPDYIFYQNQAEEIDDLTGKISKLESALRIVGWYAGDYSTQMQNLLQDGQDNTMIPIDGWSATTDNGGIKGLTDFFPIQMVVETLKSLIDTRKQIIDDVHEITGISDILRGATDPQETATAQGIKEQWGSLRVRDRQKELARFARDGIRIMGGIIAEKFSQETLKAMTGAQYPTNAEKAQMQQLVQAAQQPPAPQQPGAPPQPAPPPPPYNAQDILASPSWEDIMQRLRSQALRQFSIDIETDSTIEPNENQAKAQMVEYVEAVGEFLAKSLPVVQASPQALPIIMESLKQLNRVFRPGREMDEIIDRVTTQIEQAAAQPQQQAPQDPVAAAKVQAQQQTNQIKAAQVQQEGARSQAEMQIAQTQASAEQQRTMADAQMAQQQHQLAAQGQQAGERADMLNVALKAQELELKHEIMARPVPPPVNGRGF